MAFAFILVSGFLVYLFKKKKMSRFGGRNFSSTFGRDASIPQKSICILLMLLTSLYTFVMSNTLAAYRCLPQDDGTFTLLSAPSLDCYDSVWNENFPVIFFGILVTLSVPVSVAIILFLNRNKLKSNDFTWTFGFLISPYSSKFYWWEIVVLLKKIVYVLLVDLTNSFGIFERSFMLILFLILIEIGLDGNIRPFADHNKGIYHIKTT
jgi:ABC-type Fe3+-siderophore transport system permease subunit